MADSDGEIEYLDEDADIVQQCVQVDQAPQVLVDAPTLMEQKIGPLLVERRTRKRRKKDDDSDYDPNEDYVPPSPPSTYKPKKRQRRINVTHQQPLTATPSSTGPNFKAIKRIIRENKPLSGKELLDVRKKLSIRIPDYDDPLCLPVKATAHDSSDLKRLTNWNNVCLEHFKHCDTLLRPERGETKSSMRSVVLRNVMNKQTGRYETTIWSKTAVVNEDGDKKSEIFQCVLPRYREKKMLTQYRLVNRKPKPYHMVDEVILSKEQHKDGEALVVYKPKDALSAVYGMIDKRRLEGEDASDPKDDDDKRYLKELTCCKVCVHCYQTSHRGGKTHNKKSVVCPVCARTFASVYNLLAHFKTHADGEVRRYRGVISAQLAEIVEYHYKCRLCGDKMSSIKRLRQHLNTHQGSEVFRCEIGNHMCPKQNKLTITKRK